MEGVSVVHRVATIPAKLQLPVEVIGSDLGGRQFIESTQTLTVHRVGATILLFNKLAPHSEVIVRNLETNEEALVFVVGQIREDPPGHVYGVHFFDPSPDLWCVPFLPSGGAREVRLECANCHTVFESTLSVIELEVLEAKQDLTRSCPVCKSFTVWRETESEATATEQPIIPPEPQPAPSPPATNWEERRKYKRAAVKAAACIRKAGQEDIVTCEDLSRGGFRFVSRKMYPEGTQMEVAVPYIKSSLNIFSPASIVYCSEMKDGQFRHGVAYLKTGASSA